MFIGSGENAKTLKYIVTRFFYRGIPGVAYNALITGCRAGVVHNFLKLFLVEGKT